MREPARVSSVVSEERRSFRRKTLSTPVHLVRKHAPSNPVTVIIADMSLGGIAIVGEALALEQGEAVILGFNCELAASLTEHSIEARVVRAAPGEAGLQFTALGIAVLKDIHRLLNDQKYF